MSGIKQYVPILTYHSISSYATPKFKRYTLTPALFAEHMRYLKLNKYNPITVSQFVVASAKGGKDLPLRPIVITFDDGYRDFYTEALPVLKGYNFPATLYVSTAFVGNTSGWLKAENETSRPMLNWSQLQEICKNGIECGSHSHSHPQLDLISQSQLKFELSYSKYLLEQKLGQKISTFAYPFGYYDAKVQHFVAEIGYDSACTVNRAVSSTTENFFALSRFIIQAGTPVEKLDNMLCYHPTLINIQLRRILRSYGKVVRKFLINGHEAFNSYSSDHPA